ncbi:MAG: hypothetical protein PHD88_08695 [Firmicutes bacterium]|nr:hypothetical protein [Bacillota bacterium]MDD4263355.1 hypothetical protein [Bacillota bacterium]MDD4694455.1 hypothetical protein [Bacillota bacterium]
MKKFHWVFIVLTVTVFFILSGCGPSVVPPTNHAPVITSTTPTTNLTVEAGETKTFRVNATDADHDTLSYMWNKTLGTWISELNVDEIAWQAPNQEGLAEVSVTVSDGKLNVKHTWKITVNKQSNIVHITQDIIAPTTFESGKIYVIEDSITVTAQLTIQPGTIVKFGNEAGLEVKNAGKIIAEGTQASPIIFTSICDDQNGGDTNKDGSITSPNKGDWGEILLEFAGNSTFKYCQFIYGGGDYSFDSTVRVDETVATFRNCLFAYNNGEDDGALSLEFAKTGSYVESSTFYANTKPLFMNANLSIDNSNIFHNPSQTSQKNNINAICLSSYLNDISQNTTWGELDVPFIIEDEILITSYGVLNLDPGVVLKLGRDGKIRTDQGAIKAKGTQALPIYFTSINDDTILGDTLGDGSNITPQEKDWGYLDLVDSQNLANEFNYCYFRYGGGDYSFDGVFQTTLTNAKLSNCWFEYCNGKTNGALDLSSATPMYLETCHFNGNYLPVMINENVSTKKSNSFENNTKNAIFLSDYVWYFTRNTSWLETAVPYVIQEGFEVQEGNTLTLGAGVIIKAFRDVQINIYYGNILRQGQAIFTAYTDDTRGGDTDGMPSSGTPGYWNGIYDYGTDQYLDWADIYFAY